MQQSLVSLGVVDPYPPTRPPVNVGSSLEDQAERQQDLGPEAACEITLSTGKRLDFEAVADMLRGWIQNAITAEKSDGVWQPVSMENSLLHAGAATDFYRLLQAVLGILRGNIGEGSHEKACQLLEALVSDAVERFSLLVEKESVVELEALTAAQRADGLTLNRKPRYRRRRTGALGQAIRGMGRLGAAGVLTATHVVDESIGALLNPLTALNTVINATTARKAGDFDPQRGDCVSSDICVKLNSIKFVMDQQAEFQAQMYSAVSGSGMQCLLLDEAGSREMSSREMGARQPATIMLMREMGQNISAGDESPRSSANGETLLPAPPRELYAHQRRPAAARGPAEFTVTFYTAKTLGAGTDAQVTIRLQGTAGDVTQELPDDRKLFERGSVDTFTISSPADIGPLTAVEVWLEGKSLGGSWHLWRVEVQNNATGGLWRFTCDRTIKRGRDAGARLPAQIIRLPNDGAPQPSESDPYGSATNYVVSIYSGRKNRRDKARVHLMLHGSHGDRELMLPEDFLSQREPLTRLEFKSEFDLGWLSSLEIWHASSNKNAADWVVDKVEVEEKTSGNKWAFTYLFGNNITRSGRKHGFAMQAKLITPPAASPQLGPSPSSNGFGATPGASPPQRTVSDMSIPATPPQQEGNEPVQYIVRLFTGREPGAATTAKLSVGIKGSKGNFKVNLGSRPMQPGAVEQFPILAQKDLGDLSAIIVWHDGTGESPHWQVDRLEIENVTSGALWGFFRPSADDGWIRAAGRPNGKPMRATLMRAAPRKAAASAGIVSQGSISGHSHTHSRSMSLGSVVGGPSFKQSFKQSQQIVQTFSSLEETIEQLIGDIADCMQPRIQAEVCRMLKSASRGGGEPAKVTLEGTVQLPPGLLDSLQAFLDKDLEVMSRHMQPDLFQRTLLAVWRAIMASIDAILLNRVPNFDRVSSREVRVLERLIEELEDYVHGGGEGIPLEHLMTASARTRRLLELVESPSGRLTDVYVEMEQITLGRSSLNGGPQKHSGSVTLLDLLRILRQRTEAEAETFVLTIESTLLRDDMRRQRVVFQMEPEIVETAWMCRRSGPARAGTMYISEGHIAFTSLGVDRGPDDTMLLPLDKIVRMDKCYEARKEGLRFTLADDSSEVFYDFTDCDRDEVDLAVRQQVQGNGGALDRMLRNLQPEGEGADERAYAVRMYTGNISLPDYGDLLLLQHILLFQSETARLEVKYSDIVEVKRYKSYRYGEGVAIAYRTDLAGAAGEAKLKLICANGAMTDELLAEIPLRIMT